MFNELDTVAIVDKGVARYTCFLLIWFGESAIDHKAFAFGAHRCLTLDGAYWDVSIDDASVFGI